MSNTSANDFDYLKPSYINTQLTQSFSEGWGFDDLALTPLDTVLDCARRLFGWQTGPLQDIICPAQAALGIPGFLSHAGKVKEKYGASEYQDMTKEIALTTANGCKIPLFVDSLHIPSFTHVLHTIKAVFWGALCLYDGINLIQKWNELTTLKKERAGGNLYHTLDHKIKLTYFELLKSTTIVAMGAIMITSLLFSSIAHGILFSPAVFLGLSSSYIALNFITFFYEKMIGQWEANLPTWAPEGPKKKEKTT